MIRVFNGQDGEYSTKILRLAKSEAQIELLEKTREQPAPARHTHLFFAPIKKHRMDFLIEKAVELGASDLHPVLTQYTEMRKINAQRLRTQIIEAAEQCERLTVPTLHPLSDLKKAVAAWQNKDPILWCQERTDAPLLKTLEGMKSAFLIGPEGGFAPEETDFLAAQKKIRAVSLGPDILRSETAALYCLIRQK